MSFFYLKPVKGEIPLHVLEVIVENRLEHLKAVYNDDCVVYNEYVVEGSVYDNVGHFMLCILTILFKNREFSQFFMNAEYKQFRRRIDTLTAYEMRCFAKRLLKTIMKYDNVATYIQSLQLLCQHLMLKNIAQHICSICDYNCSTYNVRLNFKHCLPLVAKRLVEIENGFAIVPCGRWKQLLLKLFHQNLANRLNKTNLETLKCESRIMDLLNKVENMNEFFKSEEKTTILKSKDVDTASMNFPPCMLNLHQHLRKTHRLSHTQRFYYSLFLKDIGMPIEEAVNFWQSEYKLNPNGHHSCCHNWESNEKKYLYGIRHMYGLEGCRKNYTSVNCQCIQGTDNACSEGGCPFKVLETTKMIPLLKKCTEPFLSQIKELKNKQLYTSACMLTLGTSHVKLNDKFNFTPVKYYLTASRNNDNQDKVT